MVKNLSPETEVDIKVQFSRGKISVSRKIQIDVYIWRFLKLFDFICQNTSDTDIDMSKHAAAFKKQVLLKIEK